MTDSSDIRPHPTSIDHGLWKECKQVVLDDGFPLKTIKGIQQYGTFMLLKKWNELKDTAQGRTAFKTFVESIEKEMTKDNLIDDNSRELKKD